MAEPPPPGPRPHLSGWEFQRLYGPWAPFHPTRVRALFEGAPFPWWVVGGWSIEADPRAPRRPHEDTDVAVLSRDLDAVRHWLSDFHLWQPHPDGLRPLPPGRALHDGQEQLWIRRDAFSPWVLDLLLTPADGDEWVFKRDHRVRRALSETGRTGPDGVPYQRPEVGLLFKARLARDKDLGDLEATWPLLDRDCRRWLRDAIRLTEPAGHPWLARIDALGPA